MYSDISQKYMQVLKVYNKHKGLIVVDVIVLWIALGDPMGFIVLDWSICIAFNFKEPMSFNYSVPSEQGD